MGLIKFIKNLFKSKETKAREAKILKESIQLQFNDIYRVLAKELTSPKHHHSLDFLIGKYQLGGGWLRDTIYLDIYLKYNKLGRLHVGPKLFGDGVSHHSIYIDGCEDINDFRSWLNVSPTFTKTDLALSINNIVPNLIETPNE
jgi:hypothetical protein